VIAGVTGTVHYVDAGYHAMGMPPAGPNGNGSGDDNGT
jgi:enoyl-[acyl-carrier protein] reductase I